MSNSHSTGNAAALRERVDHELRSIVFEQEVAPVVIGIPASLAMGWALLPYVGTAVWVWIGLRLAVAAARLLLAAARRRGAAPASAAWYRRFLVLLALDGACWGLAGTWLLADLHSVQVAMVLCTLVGVALSGVIVLQTLLGNALFSLTMLLPCIVWQYALGDRYALYAGHCLVLVLVLVGAEAQRAELRMRSFLALRFNTDVIAQERAEALGLAERRGRVQRRFLARLSHELRTPLHGILGLARLLRGERADERLALIEQSGEHLLRIINDLLDFSKLDAGQVVVTREPFSLVAVVEDCAHLLAPTARERGLRLDVDTTGLGPQAQKVVGDAARVRQVLLNLLGNAIKFTERGGVRLVAAQHAADEVSVEVVDTGIGIAPVELDHVFEAFAQIDSALQRRSAGTGLGLTIARELARAMGGDLVASSRPGAGSTFTLRLPLARDAAGVAPRAAAPAAPAGAPLRGRVLLVEDNPVSALIARAVLESAGLAVAVAESGEAALADWQRQASDLVLMDCELPGLDGFEAARRMREHESATGRRPVPIVALTAHAASPDAARSRAAGMNTHLVKPFRREELLAVLREFLPAGAARDAAPEPLEVADKR